MEEDYPGLWQTWFTRQVAAVGWSHLWGFKLRGGGKLSRAWARARNCLVEMQPGDKVVVQLQNHRVGRAGTIVGLEVDDETWNPTVPPTKEDPDGEQGRQI